MVVRLLGDTRRYDIIQIGKGLDQVMIAALTDLPLVGILAVFGIDRVYDLHALEHLAEGAAI